MQNSGELQLLCDTLRKSCVQVSVLSPAAPVGTIMGSSLEFLLAGKDGNDQTVGDFLGTIQPGTMYKLTDAYKLRYIFFLLPGEQEETLFFLGPYAPSVMALRRILEAEAKQKPTPGRQKFLERFCAGIPVLPDNSHLFLLLDTFCERLWGADGFSVVDLSQEQPPVSPINHVSDNNEALDDTRLNMQLMEKRYNYENQLMQAVSLGQINKIDHLFASFSELSFEKRAADPLRNMKNYCIIMNTLLRKAAEQGGVHPVYLDRVSSDFAVKIEQLAAISDIDGCMRDIFRAYCRLVRKHAMKHYSPLVQNTVIYIESDLSANLTLSALAAVQKVSAGYLSTAFKQETGQTVTEYIREKRVKHAAHLLCTTHLQIQSVALHCGIMDLQYFSKVFKRQMGMTPKEYREAMK